jgi:ADP-heptose:LPS heptosyltransferase
VNVVVSPFSNSVIRDWPAAHFTRMIGLLLPKLPSGAMVRVIGTRGQRTGANEIVRQFPADRVVNDCGAIAWDDVLAMLQSAACVIGNNSGIAHLAGMYGVPTVCVFGGSHQRSEWRPLGANVVVLSRVIGCSPCHLDHNMSCPFDKACLREITPEEVTRVVIATMARSALGGGGHNDVFQVENGAAA